MQFDALGKIGFKVFCSEVKDGEMTYNTAQGEQNIQRYLKKIHALKPFCHMHQVHKKKIAVATHPGIYKSVDGLITDERFTLAVKTADCVPIAFGDKSGKVFGVIHGGRKSVTGGVIGESLRIALGRFKIDPNNVHIFLGPHIRRESYPLGEQAFNNLKRTMWSRYIEGKDNSFDLTRAVIDELVKIGVLKENINDCGIDTYRDLRFYSARRNPDNENIRFLTVIFHE